MPKALEDKLAKRYGKGSPIIYKIMNKLGLMQGNKEVTKPKIHIKNTLNSAARKKLVDHVSKHFKK